MLKCNLKLFGGRGSGGGSNPERSFDTIASKVEKELKDFINSTEISERSRMGDDDLAAILEQLPVGARIYSGSKTLTAGTIVDGKRVYEADTFYEKVEDSGRFSKYRKFGSDEYDNVYSDTILKELAKGKRLNKLNIRIEKKK